MGKSLCLLLVGLISCSPEVDPEVVAARLEIEGSDLSAASEAKLKQLTRDIARTRAALDKELRLRRRLASFHQSAGLLLLRQRSYQAAALHFSQALRETADSSMLFYYLGYALAQQLPVLDRKEREEQGARAEQAYQQALSLNADNSQALYALAALLTFEAGEHERARQLLDRYLKVRQLKVGERKRLSNLADIKALFLRARNAYLLGESQRAARIYLWLSQAAVEQQWQQEAKKALRTLGP